MTDPGRFLSESGSPVGVTGGSPANTLCEQADLILGAGTRLQDFTTGSWGLMGNAQLATLNVNAYEAAKHGAIPMLSDAKIGLHCGPVLRPHHRKPRNTSMLFHDIHPFQPE